VTLVDQMGSLLNSPDENAESAVSTRQFEYTRKLEESYQKRIVDLLEPMVGAGRVHATVTADLDFTVTEETRENYDPQKTAVRSEQTASDTHKAGDGAEGIPGALSNQPPGTSGAPAIPGAPGAAQSAAANNAPTSSSSRSTKNFEVDRTLQYVKQPTGSLKRLSVGVVLDDWQKIDANGKVTTSPMTDADIKRFNQLVREAIGLKEDRGDQLNVLNQAFKTDAPPAPIDALPIWQQPWAVQLAKQGVGALLVLIVAFLVLRPLMKTLTKPPILLAEAVPGELSGDEPSLSGKPDKDAIKLAPSFEQQVAAARSLVIQDPKRAAQVVRDWVAADG
jgi:flagellar M-ring protein FliF